jgi:hypothetical protein
MPSQTSRRVKLTAFFWLITTTLALAQHHAVVQPTSANISVPPEGDSTPMLDFGGRPVVELMINGKGPYRFIIDTGAALTVIDSSVAAELGLEGSDSIEELRIGKVAIRKLEVAIDPISSMLGPGDVPRGVLSASSFPGALVSFDYPGKRINFHKGALAEANGTNIFSYDAGDLPSVPVKAANREITIHLDTGAPYAVAFPTKYMKELPLTAPAVQKGKARTHAGTVPIFVASLNGEISIGEFKLPTREVRFTDIVPFAAVEPRGQLGAEALHHFIVTLDSLNHRVRFEKPSGASS